MYTEEEEKKGIPIRNFLLKLILVIVFVLLLIWLLPMPKLDVFKDRIFNANIQEMKDAAQSYFTTERLPQEVGDKVTISLKEMLDMKLLLPFTDKNGERCLEESSYVTLEKLETEYEMKVYLKCNGQDDYIIVKMGCYDYCPDAICEKVPEVEKEPEKPVAKGPSCTLVVASGTMGTNNWYTSDVVVKFKSKTTTTDGARITDYGLTTGSVSYNGKTSHTVKEDGTTTVYGYVKDSTGKTAVCSITVKKDTVKPSCSLEVLSGSKNSSGVYISDVVIGFNSKTDKTSGISLVGMGTSSTPTYNNKTTHTVTTNGTTKVYGYVKDAAGHTAICDMTVKREKTETTSNPSCVLEVTNGTAGTNGWYVSNVTVGFKSRTTTNGATITGFGLGTTETYANNTSYVVSNDGTTVVYGYVKDSNGHTGRCSITIKKDATKPACTLKVTSGTYNPNGYYTSNIVIGWNSRTDSTSGINGYGIGKTETYINNTSYTITAVGKHTIYGYVKDAAGNTNICSITVEKRNNLEYQYKKDIAAQYSAWTDWTVSEYTLNNPPIFVIHPLVEVVDLGKSTVFDRWEYSKGNPIYGTQLFQSGSVTEKSCKGYEYFKNTTTTTTYAIKTTTTWKSAGQVSLLGGAKDSVDTKYELVGYDWNRTCNEHAACNTTLYYIYNKYTREVFTVKDIVNITSSTGYTAVCTEVETKEVKLYSPINVIIGYEQKRTAVYRDGYTYKKRTRTLIQAAYTDYKWSVYNDTSLLNAGYTYTGNTRVVD